MRYFIEVGYKGTRYAGFQVQQNANTIQSELERALQTVFRSQIELTGSSRTDAGVHALQNFFHFDVPAAINTEALYNVNALLPADIVARALFTVSDDVHCRFAATARSYAYYIKQKKDPFFTETAWFYPYVVDVEILNQAALILMEHTNFAAFSKKNTQVKTFNCTLLHSKWETDGDKLIYRVTGNRFLRGMVRALVGTMLLAGRKKISLQQFQDVIISGDNTRASFASPAHGLFLEKVFYPDGIVPQDK